MNTLNKCGYSRVSWRVITASRIIHGVESGCGLRALSQGEGALSQGEGALSQGEGALSQGEEALSSVK